MSESKKRYRVGPKGMSRWTARNAGELKNLVDELRDAEVGDVYGVEVIEMTDEEYDALPEWEGY